MRLRRCWGLTLQLSQQQFRITTSTRKKRTTSTSKGPICPIAIDEPPFFSIEIQPGVHYTMGGVLPNERCQVLNKDGNPIPGLYAAGEVTGGVHGGNRLGGNSVADTVVFGRIAGREAVQFSKSG